jgi:hypothetical protein
MEEHTKDWNQTMLDNNLLSFEKDQINQLPLIQEDIEDSLMCMHNKDGDYSVKYGYNLIREWYHNREQGTSNTDANHKLWQTLWYLNTIPSHKDFLWRVINDAVPVRYELHK